MLTKAKFAGKLLKSNLGLFTPYELNFAITYLCNSRCQNCSIWKRKPSGELTLQEIEKIAEKMPFMQWIRLTGGEPFLRKDYVDIVRALSKNPIYALSTPTNAIMPEITYSKVSEVLEFFKAKYIITVSLDGDEKMHDSLRGVPGNWKKAVSLYSKLKLLSKNKKNLSVYFGYTIYPGNAGGFFQTFAAVKKQIPGIKINDFHVNIFQMSDIYFGNTSVKTPKDYAKQAVEEIDNILKARSTSGLVDMVERKYLILAKKYIQTGKAPMKCNILDLSCFLDPMGNVYPCIAYNRKIGNVRDSDYDIKKIMMSEAAKSANKDAKNLKCPNCWTPCEAHQLLLARVIKCLY